MGEFKRDAMITTEEKLLFEILQELKELNRKGIQIDAHGMEASKVDFITTVTSPLTLIAKESKDYSSMTWGEIRAEAKKKEMPGYLKMNREQLEKALKEEGV